MVKPIVPSAIRLPASLLFLASILSSRWEMLAAPAEDAKLSPSRGYSISGRVTTTDNRGIAGAKVFAYHQIGEPRQSQVERLIGIVGISSWQEEPLRMATAAEDGSFCSAR